MARANLGAVTIEELRQEWPHLIGAVREEIAMEWADTERTSTPESREKLHAQVHALDRLEQRMWRAIDNGK